MQKDFKINVNSLLNLAGLITNSEDKHFILNSTVLSLMGKLRVLRSCVLIEDNNNFVVTFSRGKINFHSIEKFNINNIRKLNPENLIEKKLIENELNYCIPIKYKNNLQAIICLGRKIDGTDFIEDEIQYASLVASICSIGLQNADYKLSLVQAKTNLEKRNQLLTTMFELSKDFSSFLSKQQILKMLSYRLMGQLMVSRFALILINEEQHFQYIINRLEKELPIDVIKYLHQIERATKIEHLNCNKEVINELQKIDARVISPMMVQGRKKGFLIISRKMSGDDFTEENLQFIDALGNIAISALENERLFQEELEKKRLERELEIALEIQKNLLPKTAPILKGFELYGASLPSRLVGGDYFDYIKLNENEFLIVIADVSGKGMPAALIMANVQAVLRTLAPMNFSLIELIRNINHIVYQNTSADRFVTLFCGLLNIKTSTFKYINAGHNPPFLFKKNEILSLSKGGLILGISDEFFSYDEGELNLDIGDIVVLYTDGITEAIDKHRVEFGEEKLKEIVLKNKNTHTKEIVEQIVNSIKLHSEGLEQYDDLTLVVIKKTQ